MATNSLEEWKSSKTAPEIMKNAFRKCCFDVENNCEVINDQIDAEFWKLFHQLSSETDIDEYIDFDIEIVASLPAIDPLMVDWRQEAVNKSIAEVMETSNAAAKDLFMFILFISIYLLLTFRYFAIT